MRSLDRKSTESDRFLRQALVGFMGLILRTGASLSELRAITSECALLAAEDAALKGKQQGLDIHRLASILRSWHRETRYLASDGRPSPLPLGGKSGLRALVSVYYPKSKIATVLATLKRAGLIKRHGQSHWLPTEAHVRMATDSQETLDHVSEGVSRFLETVVNNVNAKTKRDLLFEQSCKVRHLPTSNAAAFRVFVRQQALAFLTAVDDWLEARAVTKNQVRVGSRTSSAGVFTFAYIDPVRKAREIQRSKR